MFEMFENQAYNICIATLGTSATQGVIQFGPM